MKGWTWVGWGWRVGFALIFVTAAALVVVGVVTHDEPGFVDAGSRWGRVPLSVSCRGYGPADGDDACEVAEAVVARVNSRLGFAMLAWTGLPGGTDVTITMRAPVEVGGDSRDAAGGHFELTGRAGTYERCAVWSMNVSGAGDLEQLVVYHELGHCLGLAHDDPDSSGPLTRNSVMQPTQAPTPPGMIPRWIDDYDRQLLRERYSP